MRTEKQRGRAAAPERAAGRASDHQHLQDCREPTGVASMARWKQCAATGPLAAGSARREAIVRGSAAPGRRASGTRRRRLRQSASAGEDGHSMHALAASLVNPCSEAASHDCSAHACLPRSDPSAARWALRAVCGSLHRSGSRGRSTIRLRSRSPPPRRRLSRGPPRVRRSPSPLPPLRRVAYAAGDPYPPPAYRGEPYPEPYGVLLPAPLQAPHAYERRLRHPADERLIWQDAAPYGDPRSPYGDPYGPPCAYVRCARACSRPMHVHLWAHV